MECESVIELAVISLDKYITPGNEDRIRALIRQVYQAGYEEKENELLENKVIEMCDKNGQVLEEFENMFDATNKTHHSSRTLKRLLNSGALTIEDVFYRYKAIG